MSSGPRVELGQAQALSTALLDHLEGACDRIEEAGSLRRCERTVGDLEYVAIPRHGSPAQGGLFGGGDQVGPNLLTSAVESLPCVELRARGERLLRFSWSQLAGVDPPSIEVWMTTPEQWGVVQLIRTGPVVFSQWFVVEWHRRTGGRVKDGRLHRGVPAASAHCWSKYDEPLGPPLDTPDEQSVFALLGLDYIEPCERRNGRPT